MRSTVLLRACVAAFLGFASAAGAQDLSIVAPSPPGSSWDQLAQALKSGLSDERGERQVRVVNLPGSGGTVGLAQFALEGDDDALLVTGLTMLNAIFLHRVPSGLAEMTPIARLVADHFVLAVPAASPVRSVDDLRAAMAEDPGKVAWAGGPPGGIDHVAAIMLARLTDADVARLVYVPFITSAEAAAAAGESKVSAVIVPWSEIAGEAKAGRVRLLGVAAMARVPGIDAPTLADSGVAMQLSNWRGLLARPGIAPEARARLLRQLDALVGSPGWRELLERKGWQDAFLPPERFGEFLRMEEARVKRALGSAGLLKR
ncbi:tripartite tricarboxylate transporter substrate binding protein [Enterovirga sp.]|uniref:Bug family tripartite tricarboxylate transporter substrate binding protein n=1 Tax=Enterovirga sp. TaxID=2026350 RepID=UPI0026339A36|nr:tripartite tricarboxylate transporter substrate binding protein [Enterovirga sp.]MDB5590253.1 C4-dicarboxylate transporter substrate-binding protein [Enterovirga sp.]